MAQCRVYLFTYNRNTLLPRAVNSLLNQTFTDWVCEVHNDNPADDFPETYIKSLNDTRFLMNKHTENLGAVKSFNLAFTGCNEPYVSILEDDNWWEPAFLTEMIALLEQKKDANVAWANMNLWQETADNNWKNLQQTNWPSKNEISSFYWPAASQAMAALHSNSSLLYRGTQAHRYQAPENSLLNAIELIRERSFEHPLYLNHKPLANFAVTIATNRTNNRYTWIANQLMLLGSFVSTAENPQTAFQESLNYYRTQQPSPAANFFLCNLLILKDKRLYRYLSLRDWLITMKWLAKHAHKLNYIKRYLKSQTDVFEYLQKNTKARYAEKALREGL